MRPFFFSYKSITISWFLAFTIVLGILSYIITSILAKEYEEDKTKVQDIFMILLIIGFVGARLGYVLMNFDLYKDNLGSIFNLSHYNLSLFSGIIFGTLALMVLSKIYEIEFLKLLKIFVVPYYFSMSIGVWIMMFDSLMLALTNVDNVIYISLMFLLAMISQLILLNKSKNKYISLITLIVTTLLYYIN